MKNKGEIAGQISLFQFLDTKNPLEDMDEQEKPGEEKQESKAQVLLKKDEGHNVMACDSENEIPAGTVPSAHIGKVNKIPEDIILAILDSKQISADTRVDIDDVYSRTEMYSVERLKLVQKKLAGKTYTLPDGTCVEAKKGYGFQQNVDGNTLRFMWFPVTELIAKKIEEETWLTAEERASVLEKREIAS